MIPLSSTWSVWHWPLFCLVQICILNCDFFHTLHLIVTKGTVHSFRLLRLRCPDFWVLVWAQAVTTLDPTFPMMQLMLKKRQSHQLPLEISNNDTHTHTLARARRINQTEYCFTWRSVFKARLTFLAGDRTPTTGTSAPLYSNNKRAHHWDRETNSMCNICRIYKKARMIKNVS